MRIDYKTFSTCIQELKTCFERYGGRCIPKNYVKSYEPLYSYIGEYINSTTTYENVVHYLCLLADYHIVTFNYRSGRKDFTGIATVETISFVLIDDMGDNYLIALNWLYEL